MSISAYNSVGEKVGIFTKNKVFISDIKEEYPSYNDDQLMQEAIQRATALGSTAKIYWDGTDIFFTGRIIHRPSSIGGIDFCGSRIYMPDYDGGIIIRIAPPEAKTIDVPYDAIGKFKTTNQELFDKVFTINGVNNPELCLGTRMPATSYDNQTPCYNHTVKVSKNGFFETGPLYMVPTQGTLRCQNIHSYPENTFEICNATIISNSGTNMSVFFWCFRSNVHIHNFVLQGRSNVTTFHDGIFFVGGCYDVEVDHISGINPVTRGKTSGYFLEMGSVTNAYVHDVFVGDSTSWSAVGCNFLTNTTFERCCLTNWDSHYAQYGVHTIKNCVVNQIGYGGAGYGKIIVEGCIIRCREVSNAEISPVLIRGDLVSVFEGDVIIKDTIFERGEQPANLFTCFDDSHMYQRPDNCETALSPYGKRIISRCTIPDGCLHVFKTGTRFDSDSPMYEKVEYKIEDSELLCSGNVIEAEDDSNKANGVVLDKCRILSGMHITDNLSDCNLSILNCDFGSNSLRITSNQGKLQVIGSKLKNVISDESSNLLIMTGNVLSDAQDLQNFTHYSLAGNCSDDSSGNANINNAYSS